MTNEELQTVVAAVIQALKTNGKTIAQLTPVTSLANSDSLEVSGGKKIAFSKLKELVASAVVVTEESIKGWVPIESTEDLPEEPTPEEQEKAYIIAEDSMLYVYVGEGGDTLDGLYQSVELQGPQGETGPAGADGHDGVDLGEVALINDLTTGGEGNALSAEMGKTLKGLIDSQTFPIVNDLTTGGEASALSAEMGKQLHEDLDAIDFTDADADEVDIASAKIKITTDNEAYVSHTDDDGVHAVDFFIQDGEEAVAPRSVKVELDAVAGNVITGDANIELGTTNISILNSLNQEVVRIDDAGIHSPTIKEVFSPKYDCYIIPSYGQSLAVGTQGGTTTFATVEQYAYNEELTKTGISDMCQGIAEGFRLVKEANNVVLPNRTKIITFKVGTGGISVKNLSKGGTYGYAQLLAAITTAKQNCDANGLTCYVPCIAWTQGEEDMRCGGDASKYGTTGFEPTEYHNSLIALIEDLNKDIKKITGQTEDVVFVTYQTSSHTSYKRYPRIAMEQSLADDLSDKVYLVKPNYNVEYKREGSSSDPGTQGLDGFEVHCPNKSYREMGNHYGIAAAEMVLLGKRPSRMYPKSFHLSGTTMVIRFNVPVYPLVLDTTNVSNLADGNYGFCVYDVTEGIGATGTIAKATTAITNVAVTDIDEITITFSRTPQEGEVLTYGVNGDYWVNIDGVSTSRADYEVDDGVTKSGNEHGSRGCVRDSAALVNNNGGAVYTNMFNWCRIFEYKF